MKGLAAAITFLALALGCHPVHAGLFVCNNTSQPVDVAVGYLDADRDWVARGWFVIQSRECGPLLLGQLTRRYYYYYAKSLDGRAVWNDKDGAHFCTSQDKFHYTSNSDNCKGERFRKLDVGDDDQRVFYLTEKQDPTAAALKCADQRSSGADAFAKCWLRQMATAKQEKILGCIDSTKSKASFAICAANAQGTLDGKALMVATCANKYNETKRGDEFLSCAAGSAMGQREAEAFQCAVNHDDADDVALCMALDQLSDEQRRVVACVRKHRSSYMQAGLCAAGGNLSPQERRIAECVMRHSNSYLQMGFCAAGSANLTPEQQVFATCAMSTGGEPMTFAGCVGTQLTQLELQKCLTHGIGGNGCFGTNNEIVKFTSNAWRDVTQGPGPSNDLLGRDGWVGRKMQDAANDLRHGPGPSNDLVGRDGWTARTLNNAANDVTQGPGSTNDLVGKDGWACRTLLGGC